MHQKEVNSAMITVWYDMCGPLADAGQVMACCVNDLTTKMQVTEFCVKGLQ